MLPNMKYESIKYEIIKKERQKSLILGHIFQTDQNKSCRGGSAHKYQRMKISAIFEE